METPIFDFVRRYRRRHAVRLHMPGHKGRAVLGCEPYDLTEISGADVLYDPSGIIARSEENATRLFKSAHSYYTTEGSSLAIKAMLALATKPGDVVLAARNVHKSFVYASALLDLSVRWLLPSSFVHPASAVTEPEALRAALSEGPLPAAVYITSPDYLGQMTDIRAIAAVCEEYGVPLLVDNAHGAYLGFLEDSLHPIALGATACADSAHKTLPVLTGGAYLHISKRAPRAYTEKARTMLSLFASTSPSYLILASLDAANRYLSERIKHRLSRVLKQKRLFDAALSKMGYSLLPSEPMKTVISARDYGYSGKEIARHLETLGIYPELADEFFLVLMLSSETTARDLARTRSALSLLERREALPPFCYTPMLPKTALSVREAMLCDFEDVPLTEAVGRICAAPTVSCPPAVPITVCGEVIDEYAVGLAKQFAVTHFCVLKQTNS